MTGLTPPYPCPNKKKSTLFLRFLRGWRSWLDLLFERSYRMKMGHYRLPGLDVYMVNEPTLVQQVLNKQPRKYPKHRILHKMLEPLLGNSIFTTNGEIWERQRRLMDQAFEQARLKLVFPLMRDAVSAMESRLDKVADGNPYSIDAEMTHVTADIIFRTILTSPLSDRAAHDVFENFIKFQRHALRATVLELYHLPAWFFRSAAARSAGTIRGVLAPVILARYEARERGEESDCQDILAAMMDAVDPVQGDRFTYQEMVDQVCMLFLAGHETSASALAWSLYLLSNSPELQKDIFNEIETVAAGRELEFSDLKKLRSTWNLFRETLRLYPPVGFFVREAIESHCLRDKQIQPGSMVMVSPWLIHRHREYWERPDEFDPCRFDTDAGKESAKNAYLPFSQGERVCIGAAFATQEAILILASLVRRYEFMPVAGHIPQCVGRVTIRSDNGIKVRMKRRGANTVSASTSKFS
jgi:cytochrome P450